MSTKPKLLIIDDDSTFCDYISALAARRGWDCRTCTNPLKMKPILDDFQPDLLMLDMVMPGRDGIELVNQLRDCPKRMRIAFVTSATPVYLDYAKALSETRLQQIVETYRKPLRPSDVDSLLMRSPG